ncbi:MAG: hypothetical protein HND48_17320 [Chloroflexi bacterium]|nr:hypothetical protein [Chloroflexota bacterium]
MSAGDSMTHPFSRREWLIAALIAAVVAGVVVYALVPRPTYLDSYYHYNAAARLAQGDGLTDLTLWTYLGLPPDLTLPATVTPSHLYWMPMSALLSGAAMAAFGVSMDAAQIPMVTCLAGALLVAVLAGGWVTQTRRGAWLALALAAASGGFVDMWGEIDTFAPYALFGGLALAAMVAGRDRGRLWLWAAAGILGGLGHLTRSDGLLLPIVGVLAALTAPRRRLLSAVAVAAGYGITMAPVVRAHDGRRRRAPAAGRIADRVLDRLRADFRVSVANAEPRRRRHRAAAAIAGRAAADQPRRVRRRAGQSAAVAVHAVGIVPRSPACMDHSRAVRAGAACRDDVRVRVAGGARRIVPRRCGACPVVGGADGVWRQCARAAVEPASTAPRHAELDRGCGSRAADRRLYDRVVDDAGIGRRARVHRGDPALRFRR